MSADAKCSGLNKYELLCPMAKACTRFVRKRPADDVMVFTFAPFYGRVVGDEVLFGCNSYAPNGKKLKGMRK